LCEWDWVRVEVANAGGHVAFGEEASSNQAEAAAPSYSQSMCISYEQPRTCKEGLGAL